MEEGVRSRREAGGIAVTDCRKADANAPPVVGMGVRNGVFDTGGVGGRGESCEVGARVEGAIGAEGGAGFPTPSELAGASFFGMGARGVDTVLGRAAARGEVTGDTPCKVDSLLVEGDVNVAGGRFDVVPAAASFRNRFAENTTIAEFSVTEARISIR